MKKRWMALFLIPVFSSFAQAAEMKTYYSNGKIQMEVTDKGMKTYYENGQVSTETPQENGAPNGKAKTYYENGQLMSEMEYKNGEAVGVSRQFYENGKLMREEDLAKGEWKQYDENGNKIMEGKI